MTSLDCTLALWDAKSVVSPDVAVDANAAAECMTAALVVGDRPCLLVQVELGAKPDTLAFSETAPVICTDQGRDVIAVEDILEMEAKILALLGHDPSLLPNLARYLDDISESYDGHDRVRRMALCPMEVCQLDFKPCTHNQQSTSVLVQIDSQRYLFNCGEGTQRLGFENKMRMSKISAIFLTRVDWEAMGGLPGMLLTLADSNMGDLTVCGGQNLTHALAATRHFIMRNKMGLRVNEMRDGDAAAAFKDKNLHVKPVHIYPNGYEVSKHELGTGESAEDQTRKLLVARAFGVPRSVEEASKAPRQPVEQKKKGYYAEQCDGATLETLMQRLEERDEEESNKKKRSRSPDNNARQGQASDLNLPKTRPTPVALCYVAQGPDVLGKFDVQAAQSLGLKPGPLYGRLSRGESVVAPDGSTVHPSQCVGPTKAGGIFVVIDCPSPKYVDSLISNSQLASFLSDSESRDEGKQAQLVLVIHSLGPGVATDERYKSWANKFPSHVHHMLSAPEFAPDANYFQRHLRVQASMAEVDPQAYVLPQ
ncbi:hypothetical protein IWW38_002405, partial [Coemansia aciculifera]